MKKILGLLLVVVLISVKNSVYGQVYQSKFERILIEMPDNTVREWKELHFQVDAKKNILKIYGNQIYEYKIIKRYPSKEDENGKMSLIWKCKDLYGQLCEVNFYQHNREFWSLQIHYEMKIFHNENLLSLD